MQEASASGAGHWPARSFFSTPAKFGALPFIGRLLIRFFLSYIDKLRYMVVASGYGQDHAEPTCSGHLIRSLLCSPSTNHTDPSACGTTGRAVEGAG